MAIWDAQTTITVLARTANCALYGTTQPESYRLEAEWPKHDSVEVDGKADQAWAWLRSLTPPSILFNISTMIEMEAAEQLAALGHPARLSVLRTLMAAGTDGTPARALADAAGLAPNATTFHLNRLRLAGLAQRQRVGREVRYNADFAAVQALLDFLGETCCTEAVGGRRCAPVCGAGSSDSDSAKSMTDKEPSR